MKISPTLALCLAAAPLLFGKGAAAKEPVRVEEPTPEERQMIANGADIFVSIWTFGRPYPPTSIRVLSKNSEPEYFKEAMQLDRELDERLAGRK